jgi:DNA-binding NarL/FixJ family response regulator
METESAADTDTSFRGRQSVAVLHPDLAIRSSIVQWLEESNIEVPKTSDDVEALDQANLALVAGLAPQQAASIVATAGQRNQPPAVIVILNDMVVETARRLRDSGAGNDTLSDRLALLGWTCAFNRLARGLLFDTAPKIDEFAAARFPALARLTGRERQVLRFVVAGADNLKIAAHLAIRERTVKAHISNLFRKLDCENRVQLAMKANRLGVQPAAEV